MEGLLDVADTNSLADKPVQRHRETSNSSRP
jgi:hypothetical protein